MLDLREGWGNFERGSKKVAGGESREGRSQKKGKEKKRR